MASRGTSAVVVRAHAGITYGLRSFPVEPDTDEPAFGGDNGACCVLRLLLERRLACRGGEVDEAKNDELFVIDAVPSMPGSDCACSCQGVFSP